MENASYYELINTIFKSQIVFFLFLHFVFDRKMITLKCTYPEGTLSSHCTDVLEHRHDK